MWLHCCKLPTFATSVLCVCVCVGSFSFFGEKSLLKVGWELLLSNNWGEFEWAVLVINFGGLQLLQIFLVISFNIKVSAKRKLNDLFYLERYICSLNFLSVFWWGWRETNKGEMTAIEMYFYLYVGSCGSSSLLFYFYVAVNCFTGIWGRSW